MPPSPGPPISCARAPTGIEATARMRMERRIRFTFSHTEIIACRIFNSAARDATDQLASFHFDACFGGKTANQLDNSVQRSGFVVCDVERDLHVSIGQSEPERAQRA